MTEMNEQGVAYQGTVAWYVRGHQKMTAMQFVQFCSKDMALLPCAKTQGANQCVLSGHYHTSEPQTLLIKAKLASEC